MFLTARPYQILIRSPGLLCLCDLADQVHVRIVVHLSLAKTRRCETGASTQMFVTRVVFGCGITWASQSQAVERRSFVYGSHDFWEPKAFFGF